MKENKVTDENGVEEVEKLRSLMNGISNGADIPKECKECRVKVLHKGGRTDQLNNYQPIAIISVHANYV